MVVLRYAGFAPEAESIEDPAPDALFHVDITGATLDAPTSPQLEYGGGMGRGRDTHRPGFYAPSGNVVYGSDIRTLAWFLYWAFGGYKHTDDTTEGDFHIHEIWASTENMLPPVCARIGKDHFEHVFRGCVFDSLELAVEAEFAQLTASVNARKDAKAELQAIEDLLVPSEHHLAFHEVTASREGSDVSPRVNSLTFTFNNGSSVDSGQHIGDRHPSDIPAFEREVNISATLKYRDTDEIERFWGGTDGPSAEGQDEFGFSIHFDGGDGGEVDLQMPRCIYDQVPTQPSGRGEITQNVVMHAYQTEHMLDDGTTEVRSEVLATCQNNQENLTNGT